MQTITLDNNAVRDLIQAADQLAATTHVNDPLTAPAIDRLLANELSHLTDELQLDSEEHATMFEGLPFPAVHGPTPASWRECERTVETWRFVLLIVASAIGRPFGWIGQQNGRIITDLVPTKGQEHQQVGASSTTLLNLHTEDAFHPRRATHFALFGLRNPKNVGTTLAALDEAWELLDEETRSTLLTPGAVILPDDSYTNVEHSAPDSMTAVWEDNHGLGLRFDPSYTKRDTATQEWLRAYDQLANALDEVTVAVPIAPGQLLVVNNDKCVHGRVPFTPNYDGTDRWMLRVNLQGEAHRLDCEASEPGYGQHIRFSDGQVA